MNWGRVGLTVAITFCSIILTCAVRLRIIARLPHLLSEIGHTEFFARQGLSTLAIVDPSFDIEKSRSFTMYDSSELLRDCLFLTKHRALSIDTGQDEFALHMLGVGLLIPKRCQGLRAISDPSSDSREGRHFACIPVSDMKCYPPTVAEFQLGDIINSSDNRALRHRQNSLVQLISSDGLPSIDSCSNESESCDNDHSPLRKMRFPEAPLIGIVLIVVGLYGLWRAVLIGNTRNIPLGLALILQFGICLDGGVFLILNYFADLS
jgi:hypothetical protein